MEVVVPVRKIENVTMELPGERRRYRVAISFDGLDKGAEFEVGHDGHDWARQHVETGYLQDLTEGATDGSEDRTG